MKKNNLYLITVFIFVINLFSGQFTSNDKYDSPDNFKKPDLHSFERHGNLQLNLPMGTPDIGFSLFTIPVNRENSLDLNLKYNIVNVKPNNIPGWVGLGWSLDYPAIVSRELNGEVDEYDTNSYYYKYDILQSSDWDSTFKLKLYSEGNQYYEKSVTPDIFHFYVNGISGKFAKNHEGKWIVDSNKQGIKVTDVLMNNYLGMSNFIYSFTIIDNDGTKYVFGGSEDSIEKYKLRKRYTSANEFYFYIKNWQLKSIQYDSKNIVDFQYNKSSVYFADSFVDWKNFIFKDWNGARGCGYMIPIDKCFNNLVSFQEGELSYLQSIKTNKTQVIFNRSLANSLEYINNGVPINDGDIKPSADYYNTKHWYKLDDIVVSNDQNIIQKISFEYDENPSRRLKLKSIIKKGSKSEIIQKYSFDYNPDLFPNFNISSIDNWGFYNGKIFNTNSVDINNFNQILNSYSQSKEPVAKQNELLNKINYPSGGYTKFFYEPHDYSKIIDYNNGFNISNVDEEKAGGFRISEIENFDGNLKTKKKYFYVDKYFQNSPVSSGVLSDKPNYSTNNAFLYNIQSGRKSNYTNGSHILYTKVYEKLENNGISEYSFSNYDNGRLDQKANNFIISNDLKTGYVANPQAPYTISWAGWTYNYAQPTNQEYTQYNSFEKERGKILSKIDYTANGDKQREIIYEYNDDVQRFNKKIRMVSINDNSSIYGIFTELAAPGSEQSKYRYYGVSNKISAYNVYFYDYYLKSQTINEYLGNGIFSTQKKMFYNPANGQLETEKIFYPTGDIVQTNYQYAEDLRSGNQPQQNPPPYQFLPNMIAKNMIGLPLITTKYKNNIFLNRNQVIFEYDMVNDLILPKKALSYSEDKTITLSGNGYPIVTVPHTIHSTAEVTYDEYDSKGNLLQYTTKENSPTTIIWGYNQTKPIITVKGATYQEISALPAIASIVSASNQDSQDPSKENLLISALDNFKKDSINIKYQITTYTYNPLIGMTSSTPPSGIRSVYKYDYANRLQSIIDIEDNILKEYKYNYEPKKYFNLILSQTFTKNNCGNSAIGSTYIYVVPEGKYFSIISQVDADQKAQNDINVNGQATANIHGNCRQAISCYISTSPFSGGGGVLETNTNFKANISFSTGSNSTNLPWTTGVKVGNIQGICRPKTNYNSYNGQVYYTIKTDGDIILRSHNGVLPNNTTKSYDLYYPKN